MQFCVEPLLALTDQEQCLRLCIFYIFFFIYIIPFFQRLLEQYLAVSAYWALRIPTTPECQGRGQ